MILSNNYENEISDTSLCPFTVVTSSILSRVGGVHINITVDSGFDDWVYLMAL
jgi:hypothetical protein